MNAIYILWLRQVKRHLRSKSRMIGSLGQPLMYLFAFGLGFGPIFARAGQGDYIQFLLPGIIGMNIIFASVFSGIEVIWDRQFGFLKETLVAPVPRFNVMLGRTLGSATMAMLQALVVLIIASISIFKINNIWNLPIVLLTMFLISVIFTSLGTMIGSILKDMQGFHLIVNFLIMPLFFLSGALFPLKNSNIIISGIGTINPLSYGVDALRQLLSGIAHYGLFLDFGFLITVTILFLGASGYFFSRIQA